MAEASNFPRLMMTTLGLHHLGQMKMSEPHPCIVHLYDPSCDSFFGCLLGGNIMDVRFPASYARELTIEEAGRYRSVAVEHGCLRYPLGPLVR